MFGILKASIIVSIATVITILIGVIRSKFTAVTLGPAGVGIFSQANSFFQFLLTAATLCLGPGVTKYIAQYNSEKNESMSKGVIFYAVWAQFLAAIIIVGCVALAAEQLSNFLFGSGIYKNLLIILSLGLPFMSMASAAEYVFFGFNNYKAFAKGRSFSAIISLIPLFLLVGLFGIKGAFVYVALSAVLTFLVHLYFLYKSVPHEFLKAVFEIKKFIARGHGEIKKNLLSYGGVSFINTVTSLFTIVYLRSLLIKRFGPESNGFYQVVFALSTYYLPFFTNGIWTYFYPKMSSVKDAEARRLELNNSFRFCVLCISPVIVGLFILRNVAIRLIFSEKFMYSAELFSTQLFGDLFYLLFYLFCTSLLAYAYLKAYVFMGAIYSVLQIGLFFVLNRTMNIKAITTSYLLTNLILVAIMYVYHIKRLRIIIDSRNRNLLLSAMAVSGICLFAGGDSYLFNIFKILLVVCWLFIVLTLEEKQRIWNYIYERYKKIIR